MCFYVISGSFFYKFKLKIELKLDGFVIIQAKIMISFVVVKFRFKPCYIFEKKLEIKSVFFIIMQKRDGKRKYRGNIIEKVTFKELIIS